jgi:hypothetical protein
MFDAGLLSKRALFPRFSDWVERAHEGEWRGMQEFLFRASCAVLALEQMRLHHKRCTEHFQLHRQSLTLKRPRLAFWSPHLIHLFQQITPFLSAVRFMQDMLIPMVSRRQKTKGSVPQSLNQASGKIGKFIAPELALIIQQYWNNGGLQVRNYRVLDQHYFALCKHVFLQWDPDVRLVIMLPDDPTICSEAKVTFTLERDALPYFEEAFRSFHQCVEDLSAGLGFVPSALKQRIDLSHMGRLEEGARQTMALWITEHITGSGIEIGQTEERRVFVRNLIAPEAPVQLGVARYNPPEGGEITIVGTKPPHP